MFGWLKKKGEDSRIYMCIKEVKWNLETSDSVERAKILAIASMLGNEFFGSGEMSIEIVNNPMNYSRDDLLVFYGVLEDIRNSNTIQINNLKKMMSKYGMDFPKFAEDHAKQTGRSLEIWMATIGAGLALDRRDDVKEIWNLLTSSKPSLDKAIDEIVETEKMTLEMTGNHDGMFSNYDPKEWKSFCDFIPTQFSNELYA